MLRKKHNHIFFFFPEGKQQESFILKINCDFLSPRGGPLCEGDIEEADGVLQVFCPWHDYDFDLRTGKSGTSLQVSEEICPSCIIIYTCFPHQNSVLTYIKDKQRAFLLVI